MPVLPNPDYMNHPVFQPSAHKVDEAARAEAMNKFLPAFQKGYNDWIAAGRPDFEARIGAGDEVLRALQADGYALLKMDAGEKARLVELVSAEVAALEANLAALDKPKFRDMNRPLERKEQPAVYELVERAFKNLHVLDAASAYARRPMRVKKLFVQLNNARETRARYGVIDEAGLPPLKTDYWHIDSDIWPNVKVLMYLNDVGLDQGPLRYVPGSHRDLPCFETVVRKTNDTLKLPTAQFLALPEELRMHALFGPYLTGQEPQAAGLLERERAVCGGGADVILFDNNGVHRGGFVRSGSRRIMQVLFEAA